jgi:hypothetical protein
MVGAAGCSAGRPGDLGSLYAGVGSHGRRGVVAADIASMRPSEARRAYLNAWLDEDDTAGWDLIDRETWAGPVMVSGRYGGEHQALRKRLIDRRYDVVEAKAQDVVDDDARLLDVLRDRRLKILQPTQS